MIPFSAEYMLDVIGAGASGTSQQNWDEIWKASPEAKYVEQEIDAIHKEGRNRTAVTATLRSEFATSRTYQVWELLKRDAESYWRDPTYLVAKLSLNAVGGLFVGFTFFKSPDTQQGTQNKLFVCRSTPQVIINQLTCLILGYFLDHSSEVISLPVILSSCRPRFLSAPVSIQLQVPFINTRTIYEIRERPSRMYSWIALLTSQILIELLWNILGSTILFLTWYWTIGFENSRAGYTYLMLGIVFPAYYTTFAQVIFISSLKKNF